MRAFTLIETLLSFTLLALVLVFVLNLFPSSLVGVRSAEQRYQAATLADSLLERQMVVPFSQIPVGLSQQLPPQVYDQVEYRTKLEVVKVDGDPQYVRGARATVEWTVRGQTRQVVRELWIYHLPSQTR